MKSLDAYKLFKKEVEDRTRFKKVCDSCVPEEYIDLSKYGEDISLELSNHQVESLDDLHKLFMNYDLIIRLLGKWKEMLQKEGSNSKEMVLNDLIFYLGVLTGE